MRLFIVTALFVLSIVAAMPASAQTRLSVATDASPWFLRGYSAIVMAEPDHAPRWRFSAELWGMDYPDAIVDLQPRNSGEGWHRRFTHALAIYADYHPSGGGESWHVGGAVDWLRSRVTRDANDESGVLYSAEFLVRGGYRWFPVDGWGLFANPWLAAGYIFPASPAPAVGDEEFAEFPLQLLGTLHVGWRI